MKKRPIFKEIFKRINEPKKFMQVLLGPRQVGKTTLVNQLEEKIKIPSHYISADTATLENLTWLKVNWEIAREKAISKKEALLIIDEVQKIPDWSLMIKKLWDEDMKNNVNLKVIILGSSPWLMQKGLSESLAGRFEIIPITHWNFNEMNEIFNLDVDQYVFFGGYPGPVLFIKEGNFSRWKNYINDSLIETTISRDIFLMSQINKPILFRRLFQLGCHYSSQILSYQKMLGQLQDAGNTTTLAHYLELLSGANLITGLNKFSNQEVRTKLSSPKFQVYNTALMSSQVGKTFKEAKKDKEFWGRLVESSVGAYLVNQIRGTQIELYYWREKNFEVDFVIKKGKDIIGIEVKSSCRKFKLSGMDVFSNIYKPKRLIVVGENGISLEEFLRKDIEKWF